MHKTKKFLIKDLEEHGCQMSWDLEADARFAHFIGDLYAEQVIVKAIERSKTAFPKHVELLSMKITGRRLRALNGLVKKGLVISYWEGTSIGGMKNFGTCRIKVYKLSTADKVKVEAPLSTKIGYTSSINKRVLLKRRPK